MTDRIDMDRLAESAYQSRDPQFDEEALEEKYRKMGEKLAEQVLRNLKQKFIEALDAEMPKISFNYYATAYISDQKDSLFDELEEELISWIK